MRNISSTLAVLLVFFLLAGCNSPFPIPPAETGTPGPTPTSRSSPTALTSSTPLPTTRSVQPQPVIAGQTAESLPPQAATPSPTPVPSLPATPAPQEQIPVPPGQHLFASYRAGQTFLTWDELSAPFDLLYRVYRSSQPIDLDKLDQALWLSEVANGSADFYAGRFQNPDTNQWEPRYLQRLVTQERGPELAAGKGLLVWTVSRDDLDGQESGPGYYAVTVLLPDGSEQLLDGYSLGPINEGVMDPLPVETRGLAGPGGHVLLQYMDLNTWNPTFHAPNPLNSYYGLSPIGARFESSLQYAFDYVVYDPVCPGRVEKAPVILVLDDTARSPAARPVLDPELAGWCAYKIYPVDPGDTLWFGFAQTHDYRQSADPQESTSIANFTEQRLLRMVYDLVRQPTAAQPADPARVYVLGKGVSGDRAIALATHFGNVFAAAYAVDPIRLDPNSTDRYSTGALPHLTRLWGAPGLRLLVSLNAPGGWGSLLQDYNDYNVWDWQGYDLNLRSIGQGSPAPVGIAFYSNQYSWKTGMKIPAILNRHRRPWAGYLTTAPSSPLPLFPGLPPGLQSDRSGLPFAGFKMTLTESVPAFSNDTLDSYNPVSEYGGYNGTLLWSSSWQPWNGSPIDTPDRYEISICAVAFDPFAVRTCGSGREQRVDITPRRLQRFIAVPGMQIEWRNYRLPDDALVASGRVPVASDGTFTVPGFLVQPQGNRLVLAQVPESGQQKQQ